MNESVTELANIWGLALSNIEKELNNKIVFDSFFTDTKIAKAEGNIMTIVASSSLAVSMFKNQFLKTIKSAVNKATGTEYVLEFKTKEEFESSKPSEDEAPHFFPKARLDPRFSFDNFVVGSSDIEARQAAVLIASNPGKTFNPLLIYGDSGLGKTHLLEAIGNEIREQFPNLKVLYVSADYFLEESVKYMASYNADQSFVSYFRDEVDVLLLDDVQYLKGKTQTMG
ncbi:MAG: ATP-binding protein, partial [Bacilli bacterium]|nr:ATP-binding protein [Bacilli bacterium]